MENNSEVKQDAKKQNNIKDKILVFILLILILGKFFLLVGGNHYNYEKDSYHDVTNFSTATNEFTKGNCLIIDNYNLYKKIKADIASKSENKSSLNFSKFGRLFFVNNNLLAVICCGSDIFESKIEKFSRDGNNVNITMYLDADGITAGGDLDLYFIPISKVIKNVKIDYTHKSNNDGGGDIF